MKSVAKKNNDQLVTADGKFIFCDSRTIAEKFEIEHKKVIRTISRIEGKNDRFQQDNLSYSGNDFSPIFQKYEDSYQGKTFTAYRLNESAFSLVAMRFETDSAFVWQRKFAEAFSKMKATLLFLENQKSNTEWLERRASGKITRRIETDTVQRFIEYATNQGSRNARHYYSNISTMQNKALFLIDQKFKNVRDILDLHQIGTIEAADRIVVKALDEGMNTGLDYKEIYQNAKRNVELFAMVHGKTPVPVHQIQHVHRHQLTIA